MKERTTPEPLTADEIAQRLSRLPGKRLVTYREVGLPHWETRLRCRILEKKDLPAIDEFVLRCTEAELRSDAEVASFLGLPTRVVTSVMGRLVASQHLSPLPPDEAGRILYTLTLHGRRTLADLGEIRPVEKVLAVAYDGLLREFVSVEQVHRWRPRDLRDQEILEIPAFPADPPDVGPSDTSSVAEVLKAVPEFADHQLLSVLGLEGKREKFFVRAVALVYESTDDGEVSVDFAIDGRISDQHGLAFARAEGQRKLGIVGTLRQQQNPAHGIISPDLLREGQESGDANALRRATETLGQTVDALHERLAITEDEDDRARLMDQIADLERRLEEAESALDQSPVRILEVHEHPKALDDALKTAQARLLIVSPWIRAAVVNKNFLNQIVRCLERGVEVSIGYGIDDGKDAFERDQEAEQSLLRLAEQRPNLTVTRLGDTHAKVLVCDTRYVIVTSFNWLSFRGDPNRPFRDERGTLVAVPSEVDRIYNEYQGRIAAG
jgi:hypothetical protein